MLIAASPAGASWFLGVNDDAIVMGTPGRAALGVAVVALALIATSLISVELRGGGRVRLALPVLIAAPAMFHPPIALTGIVLGGCVVAVLGARRGLLRSEWRAGVVLALVPALTSATVHLALADEGARTTVLAAVGVAGLAALGAEVFARWKGLLSLPRAEATEVAIVLACLWSGGALIGVTAERGGPLAAAIALIPLAILTISYRASAEARRTADQTLDALATIPEVTGDVAAGHGPRVVALVEAVADVHGFSWKERESMRTAARLHRLHRVLGDPAPIFEQVGVRESDAVLIQATRTPARRADDRIAAVVRVADTFGVLLADRSVTLAEAITRLRAAHPHGAEADAAADLVMALDRRPRLLDVLRSAPGDVPAEAPKKTGGVHGTVGAD